MGTLFFTCLDDLNLNAVVVAGDGDFDDVPEPDLDDEVKLKPGDAPLKVYHPFGEEARAPVPCCSINSA